MWGKDEFIERKFSMQEIYQKYFDDGANDPDVKTARVSAPPMLGAGFGGSPHHVLEYVDECLWFYLDQFFSSFYRLKSCKDSLRKRIAGKI